MGKKFFTIEEVAEKCNLSTITIRRKIKSKELPFFRYGRKIVIKSEDLREWAKKNRAIINE